MKKVQLSKELLIESNIPGKFWPFGLSGFRGNKTAEDQTVKYIQKSAIARAKGIGVFFYGRPQTFRTFLGTFVLKCVLARGFSARYTTLPDIAREHFGEGETRHSVRALYGGVDFVFIDDLIATPHKGEIQGLARVLQVRATAGLPTLFAAALPIGEMAEHYTDTVARHFDLAKPIDCNSDSAAFSVHRLRASEKSEIWEEE